MVGFILAINSKQSLWFVGGGREAIQGLLHAKALGYHVIVSDGKADAPGLELADVPILASTYDSEATIAAAKAYQAAGGRIDGVLSLAVDVPLTVAALAHALSLPSIPMHSAQKSSDKLLMKDCLKAAQIPIPHYAPILDEGEVSAFAKLYPEFILKPVDSRGARGVSHLKLKDGEQAFKAAFQRAIEASPTKRVMAEEYLSGRQFSTEGILLEGEFHPMIVVERNYARNEQFYPFIIEDGGNFPPNLATEDEAAIANLALAAGAALGVKSGVVKGDMVLTPTGAKVIEVALRPSGGYLCTHQIPLATGVDFVGLAIKLALGERPSAKSLKPEFKQDLAIRYFFPEITRKDQRLLGINGVEKWLAHPQVVFLKLFVAKGDIMASPDNHTSRAGCVLVRGVEGNQAIDLINLIMNDINFLLSS